MSDRQEIETLLKRWGAWAAGGVGTNIKPLMMWQLADPKRTREAMTDEEAETFDPAVASLRLIDKDLFEVVRLHYVYGLSFNAIARVKHVSKQECFLRSIRAKSYIEGYLTGYAAAGEKLMACFAELRE